MEKETETQVMQMSDLESCDLEMLFEKAEQLIEQLKEPGLPLEQAFLAYEQGIQVIRACNERIDSVEKQMQMMNANGELEAFGESTED